MQAPADSRPAGTITPVSSVTSGSPPRREILSKRWIALYAILTVLVVVIVIVAALTLAGDFRRGGNPSAILLVPKGTRDVIPAEQFDSVAIDARTDSTITGNVVILFAVDIYLMTTSQFNSYDRTLNVSGYQWTSGIMQNVTSYSLEVAVPPGLSYLVYSNPYPVSSLVGYNTNLNLEPE